jgi:hypothetical protein
MRLVYQWVKTAGLFVTVLALAACGSQARVDLPSNHGHALDDALRRLHAVGLRASFPATRIPCGDGLPQVDIQSPRAPVRVERGSTVRLKFMPSFIPSPAVPKHHARWTHIPPLVGKEFAPAVAKLNGIWPCVRLRPAAAASATRAVIVAQSPPAGTRVPAFGVMVGRGYRPTTVDLTVAARS